MNNNFKADTVVDFYTNIYDESKRLKKDRRHLVELRVKESVLEDYIKNPEYVIYDMGAGTGFWSEWLLNYVMYPKLYAFDLVPKHVEWINEMLSGKRGFEGACVLDVTRDDIFDEVTSELPKADIILLGGPLYHVKDETACVDILKRLRRVLAPGGRIFVDWLSIENAAFDTVLSNSTTCNKIEIGKRLKPATDNMFSYLSVAKMNKFAKLSGFMVDKHIPLDGISRLVSEKLDNLSDENFEKYISLTKSLGREYCRFSEHNLTVLYKIG